MFKKSFLALLASALLALAAIVAYSALGLRTSAQSLADAKTLAKAGSLVSAVHLLEMTESSVRNDPVLREQLLRQRYAANSELGNAPAHALFDRLKVKPLAEGAVTRSFDGYQVTFDGQPVTLGQKVAATPGVMLERIC